MQKFIDSSANFRNNLHKMLPPVADSSLAYIGLFGGSKVESQRNYAIDQPDCVIVGAPTYNANSVVFDEADYMQLGFADSADLTLIMACRIPAAFATKRCLEFANNGTLCVNAGATGTVQGRGLFLDGGASFYQIDYEKCHLNTATPPTPVQGAANSVISPNVSAGQLGLPVVLTGRSRSSDNSVIATCPTFGTSGPRVTSATELELGGPYTIGSSPSSSLTTGSQSECFMAMAYQRYLSDAELASIYQFMKTYLASVGVTV